MVFLTGDTHGEFGRIEEFCAECGTSTDDVMVILGDAGINFYRDKRDDELKEYLEDHPGCTLDDLISEYEDFYSEAELRLAMLIFSCNQ